MSDENPFGDLDQEEEEQDGPSEEERKEFQELIGDIIARCKSAGIEFEEDEDGEFGANYDLYFQDGREKRKINIWDIEDAKILSEFKFENIRFINGYLAFCSYEIGVIICCVRSLSGASSFGRTLSSLRASPQMRLLRSISPEPNGDDANDQGIAVSKDEGRKAPKLFVNGILPITNLMTGWAQRTGLEFRAINQNITNHDQARSMLEKLSDSLFLQIENQKGVALALSRTPHIQPILPKLAASADAGEGDYVYPTAEYDHDPLTFYWYAFSASPMPLVQFLAYYQAIEFYFPIYSKEEAKKAVKRVLLRPGFRPDNDTDLNRVLDATALSSSRGFLDEKSQLEATLKACVSEKDLLTYLTSSEKIVQFFSKDKVLGAQKLNLSSHGRELIPGVATRIYQLRCRIVHAKSDDATDRLPPLLPFTKEEASMVMDIGLVKLLASSVISANGIPLTN